MLPPPAGGIMALISRKRAGCFNKVLVNNCVGHRILAVSEYRI